MYDTQTTIAADGGCLTYGFVIVHFAVASPLCPQDWLPCASAVNRGSHGLPGI